MAYTRAAGAAIITYRLVRPACDAPIFVPTGDRVVGRYTYTATHAGLFLGIPPTGNWIAMRSIDIWRVHDGKFIEHWDELNLLGVFQQLGVIPPLFQ